MENEAGILLNERAHAVLLFARTPRSPDLRNAEGDRRCQRFTYRSRIVGSSTMLPGLAQC